MKRGEVCEELRKRMIDVCCLQEVRGQGARMLGVKGRRCKLWLSGKGDGVGGVGVIVKEELCEKVVEIKMVSDRVMTIVVVVVVVELPQAPEDDPQKRYCCCFLRGWAEADL